MTEIEKAERALGIAYGEAAVDHKEFNAALAASASFSLLSIAKSLDKLANCVDNEHFAYRVFVARGEKK